MPVDQPVQLNVVVVLAERINQHLGDFQPADVEAKLQGYIGLMEKALKKLRGNKRKEKHREDSADYPNHLQRREERKVHVRLLVLAGAFRLVDELSAE